MSLPCRCIRLGSVQGIDFGAALMLILREYASGEDKGRAKISSSSGAGDVAADVTDDAAQIGFEPERPIGALELLGMGIALMLDQRRFADRA